MTKANDEASDFDKARTNEIGLIPCPFCGGSPRREFDRHRNDFCRTRYRIVCTSCYAGTRWYDDPDEAWLMWNGRVKE